MEQLNKNDKGKLEWDLLPYKEMEEVIKVLMNGADTYGKENWKKGSPDDIIRYNNAIQRHLASIMEGETKDIGEGGDGLSHYAHIVCDALFCMWFEKNLPKQSLTYDVKSFEKAID